MTKTLEDLLPYYPGYEQPCLNLKANQNEAWLVPRWGRALGKMQHALLGWKQHSHKMHSNVSITLPIFYS